MGGRQRQDDWKLPLLLQLLTLALSLIYAFFRERSALLLLLIPSLIYLLIFYISAYRRSKRIRALSESLDRILHSGTRLSISEYREGELGVLAAEIEKLLIRLFEQSEQLKKDKMFLSSSLADISHQLRTPLTSVHLLLAKLSDGTLDKQQRMQTISEIYKLLDQINWLVDVLLKISKIDAGSIQFKKDTFRLDDLVSKSLAPLVVKLDLQNIRTDIKVHGYCEADFSWTAEALGNVLKNCAEHAGEGGRLEISGGENALYTEIRVRDSGPGIDPEDLPHIFERFYKGKNSSPYSVGIGLALARMIVSSQGGVLKAANHPEGGAVFTLRFYKSVV